MSRWAQIVTLDYSISRDMGGMLDRDGRYAGMGGRTRSEGAVSVRMELQCSTESVQWLQVAMGQGGPTDMQDLAQSIGLEQPGRRAQKRPADTDLVTSTDVQSAGTHDKVRVWNRGALAGVLTVQLGDGKALARLLKGVDEPATSGTCPARHASGVACVLPAGSMMHNAHRSKSGWAWTDTGTPECGHKMGGRVCRDVQAHGGPHNDAVQSWSWGPCAAEVCGRCGSETVVRVNRRSGQEFTACTEWPSCTWTFGRTPPQVVRCTVRQRVTDLQCAREQGHDGPHVTMGASFGTEADVVPTTPGYVGRQLELEDD